MDLKTMGFKAEIWAWRWGGGVMEKEEDKEKGEEEKIPLCESIGHRLLRGRCPKNSLPGAHFSKPSR